MKAVERMHLGKVAEIGCIACLKAGSAYVGAKKKEKDDKGKTMVADIEKVDASKIAAQKAEAERQYEENKKKQRKRSAIEIAMGASE